MIGARRYRGNGGEAQVRDWARHEAVTNLAFDGTGVDFICAYGARAEGLALTVNEIASNAVMHGSPPATLRVWSRETELVCEVSDSVSIHAAAPGGAPADRLDRPQEPGVDLAQPGRPAQRHRQVQLRQHRPQHHFDPVLTIER